VLEPQAQITYLNTHADFVGGLATTALANTYSVSATVKNSDPIQYVIDVPKGAARVGASLALKNNSDTDLDLYLFDCTGSQCVLRDFATGNGSVEQVVVNAPAAGLWKVVIDPFRVAPGRNTYIYKDYFLDPSLGQVEVTNGPRKTASGNSTTQFVNLNVNGNSGERQLEAMIEVTNEPAADKSTQATSDQADAYYADRGILGTMNIRLQHASSSFNKKLSSHGARP